VKRKQRAEQEEEQEEAEWCQLQSIGAEKKQQHRERQLPTVVSVRIRTGPRRRRQRRGAGGARQRRRETCFDDTRDGGTT